MLAAKASDRLTDAAVDCDAASLGCSASPAFLLLEHWSWRPYRNAFIIAGVRLAQRPGQAAESSRILEGVVLLLFRAHGEKCRGDDHSEKYQARTRSWTIGESPFWAVLPSLSNHVPGY